ncbi:MAG: biotin--[acetyl-CoA-carboxylase] ligase [Candidatus Margulisiibacteriota bacterium]|nr:biotin--[acetyl-CoA-carboxylase] ligase [Candidatus Margulisiibacteriota bacterium]
MKKIIYHNEIDSTNDEARRLIKKGASEGMVIVAGTQAKGRGKPGSGWFSPPDVGIYLSVILKPFKNPNDLSSITIIGARAVIKAIKNVSDLAAEIKLPNDVLINGKKIAGILTERDSSGNLIIGIGININNPTDSFPDDIAATSLKIETKKEYGIKGFIDSLLAELDREYLAYLGKI